MQFKTSSSCHLLNLYSKSVYFTVSGFYSDFWERYPNLIRKMKIQGFSYIISDHLIIQSNCRARASTSMRSDHISRVGIAGHLGPRTSRPRTTRPVSPDYSDRVTGPLGPCLLNSDRAHETRKLGPLL